MKIDVKKSSVQWSWEGWRNTQSSNWRTFPLNWGKLSSIQRRTIDEDWCKKNHQFNEAEKGEEIHNLQIEDPFRWIDKICH